MNKKLTLLIAGLTAPTVALAHPGHDTGFLTALAHPFTGIDHLLMMVFVGLWAGRVGGNARWQLPLGFLTAMAAGFLLGSGNIVFDGIDNGIAAGLIALGAVLAINLSLPRAVQLAIVAAFALLHGLAHGIELHGAQPLSIFVGLMSATALLHAFGVFIATKLRGEQTLFYRMLGTVLAMIGGGFLFVGL